MQNSSISKQIIIWIVAIALFIDALDATIINTAIPTIARYMSVNPIDLKIALISYLLSLALFIPISGWLADKYGQRNIFVLSVIIFTVSSLGCGLAHNLWQLIIMRFLQGIGGAMMTPVGRLIAVRAVPRSEYINIMNKIIMIALIGPAVGPFIGGVICDWFSWRWIFFVNVPIGIIEAIITWTLISNQKESVNSLDKIGFLLFGLSLGLFIFALSALSEEALSLHIIAWMFIASIVGFFGYFRHSLHRKNPILYIQLFKLRTFAISIYAGITMRTATGGIYFLCPLLLQLSLGFSPFKSGLLCIALAIGAIIAKTYSRQFTKFFGIKRFLLIINSCVAVSIFSFLFINQTTASWVIFLLIFICGLCLSFEYSGMNPLAFADVDKKDLSKAIGITSTAQQIGTSMGVAMSALLLTKFSAHHSDKHHLPLQVFHDTFITLSVLSLITTLVFICLKKHDGDALLTNEK